MKHELVGQENMFLDAILQAAIAARRDLPVPFEIEIAVGIGAEEVLGDGRMRGGLQASVFDGERGPGRGFRGGVDPVGIRFAIEQQLPAGGLFLRSELVVGGAQRQDQERRKWDELAHAIIVAQCGFRFFSLPWPRRGRRTRMSFYWARARPIPSRTAWGRPWRSSRATAFTWWTPAPA